MKNLVILLYMLSNFALADTVLSQGINTTITPSTLSSISPTYIHGVIVWSRDRTTEGVGDFPEKYTLNLHAGCKITCGPFAWPVKYKGKLFCERDTSKYSGTNIGGDAYATHCIPNVSEQGFQCDWATYNIYHNSHSGACDENLNPFYANTNYDCCINNSNRFRGYFFNVYTDRFAIIN